MSNKMCVDSRIFNDIMFQALEELPEETTIYKIAKFLTIEKERCELSDELEERGFRFVCTGLFSEENRNRINNLWSCLYNIIYDKLDIKDSDNESMKSIKEKIEWITINHLTIENKVIKSLSVHDLKLINTVCYLYTNLMHLMLVISQDLYNCKHMFSEIESNSPRAMLKYRNILITELRKNKEGLGLLDFIMEGTGTKFIMKSNEKKELPSCSCGKCNSHNDFIVVIKGVVKDSPDFEHEVIPIGCCGSCMSKDIVTEHFNNIVSTCPGGVPGMFPENIDHRNGVYRVNMWVNENDGSSDLEVGNVFELLYGH